MGTVHVTKSGKQCQLWSACSPHEPYSSYTDDKFPDGSRVAARNYCRNPAVEDGDTDGVFCYTMDPDTQWEPCDVPLCGKSAADCIMLVHNVCISGITVLCSQPRYLGLRS